VAEPENEFDTPESGDGEAFTLEELLSEVSVENLHDEITSGQPVGREVW